MFSLCDKSIQNRCEVAHKHSVAMFSELMQVFVAIHREFWPIFRTWNGSLPEVHIQRPEDVEVCNLCGICCIYSILSFIY
jgi:hypothetical protein